MKTNTMQLVREFHVKFGHPVNNEPCVFNQELNNLRVELLREELAELQTALNARNRVLILDALCDLQVVLDGAFLSLGFWKYKDAAFEEVMRANMSKLGLDGKPVYRHDGKILKGPNYKAPQLKVIVT